MRGENTPEIVDSALSREPSYASICRMNGLFDQISADKDIKPHYQELPSASFQVSPQNLKIEDQILL